MNVVIPPEPAEDVAAKLAGCKDRRELQERLSALVQEGRAGKLDDATKIARAARTDAEPLAGAQVLLHAVVSEDPGGDANQRADALQRILDYLKASEVDNYSIDAWLIDAFKALGPRAVEHAEEFTKHAKGARPNAEDAVSRFRGIIGLAKNTPLYNELKNESMTLLVIAIVLVVGFGIVSSKFVFDFPIPSMKYVFGTELFWRISLWYWLPALVVTWVLAFLSAQARRVHGFISPRHFMKERIIVTGRHAHFWDDVLFHIFQFIWFPIMAFIIFASWSGNQITEWFLANDKALGDKFAAARKAVIGPFWDALSSGNILHMLINEQFGMAIGAIFAGYTVYKQLRVQQRRLDEHSHIYFWDVRCARQCCTVRIIMLIFDMFFAALIIQKAITFCAIEFIAVYSAPYGIIDAFAADHAGGLGPLRNGIMVIAGGIGVFGLFVYASWHAHKGLPEYGIIDALSGMLYVSIMCFLVIVPMWHFESELWPVVQKQKEARIETLEPKSYDPPSVMSAKNAAREQTERWSANGLDWDWKSSPLAGLLLQLAAGTFAYVRRGRHVFEELISS